MANDDHNINDLLANVGSAAPSISGGSISSTPNWGGMSIVGTSKMGTNNPASVNDDLLWDNTTAAYWGITVDDDEPGDTAKYYHQGAPEEVKRVNRPVGAIMASLLQMSDRDRVILQKKLERGGYLNSKYRPGAADDATVAALSDVLLETAREGIAKGESMSWQEYLQNRVRTAEDESAQQTHTQTSVSVTSKESGRGVIWDAFKQAVGRNPTEDEINKFMDRLNAAERANPTVTTQNVDASGNMTSTTTGGFDGAAQADMVRQETMANPDYQEHQVISTYMPALMQLMNEGSGLQGGL